MTRPAPGPGPGSGPAGGRDTWSDHRSRQRGRDHLYAHPSPPACSGVSTADCGLVAHPRYRCRTPEWARRVAEVSREGRVDPHPVGVMRALEGGCTMAAGTGITGAPREWSHGPCLTQIGEGLWTKSMQSMSWGRSIGLWS